jgi:hypothetical protein
MTEGPSVDLLIEHLAGKHRTDPADGCAACDRLAAAKPEPKPRAPRVEGDGLCECGCGQIVKRRFLPGHDAKLKSRLNSELLEGSEAARRELGRRGWLKTQERR